MSKPRILYVLKTFLQISQTYVRTEVEALELDYEIKVLALDKPDMECPNNYDCKYFEDFETPQEMLDYVENFNPQIIHCHYWNIARVALKFSEALGIPFTLRTHSFDVLRPVEALREGLSVINSKYCIGVQVFPFLVEHLLEAGVEKNKVAGCYPLIKYSMFHDESPNGKAVMNTGACLPKKNMEQFIDIAEMVPEKPFTLYPLGYSTQIIQQYNRAKNNIVNIQKPFHPVDMPQQYKKHEWLLYTADPKELTVGWPMAIAEAQASGVGVLMPRIRPDIEEFIGGAGFVYDSIEEAAEIVSGSYSGSLREKGFEQSKKSDIDSLKHILTNVWEAYLESPGVLEKKSFDQEFFLTGNYQLRTGTPQLLRKAVSSHKQGDLMEAKSVYQQVLKINPNQPDALRLYGVIRSKEGFEQEAIALIQQSITEQPENALVYQNLGDVFIEHGRIRKAIRAYGKSLAIKPDSASLYQKLGQLYRQIGESESALDCYEKALGLKG